jgi:hypothetical protein
MTFYRRMNHAFHACLWGIENSWLSLIFKAWLHVRQTIKDLSFQPLCIEYRYVIFLNLQCQAYWHL